MLLIEKSIVKTKKVTCDEIHFETFSCLAKGYEFAEHIQEGDFNLSPDTLDVDSIMILILA